MITIHQERLVRPANSGRAPAGSLESGTCPAVRLMSEQPRAKICGWIFSSTTALMPENKRIPAHIVARNMCRAGYQNAALAEPLAEVMRHLMSHNGHLKTAILP
jgi:hypothetical protein